MRQVHVLADLEPDARDGARRQLGRAGLAGERTVRRLVAGAAAWPALVPTDGAFGRCRDGRRNPRPTL